MTRANGAEPVVILGAGSWGTALAILLADKGLPIFLWGRDPERILSLAHDRENRRYLPGVPLPPEVTPTTELGPALARARAVVFAVPAQAIQPVAELAAPHLRPGLLVVCAAKGIDADTLRRPSEIIQQTLPAQYPLAVLAGPSLAREVARFQPTAVVAAAELEADAIQARDLFHSDSFRVYSNTDVVGVEVGVAVKNVIAIAAGMSDGLGFGDNTRGALLTRGLAEMNRLGTKLGARPGTLYGLAGMGDLVATCASRLSRNRHVGEQLGRGRPLARILSEMVHVAEGVRTARAVHRLAAELEIDMPITAQVHAVLYEGQDARAMMTALMGRQARSEVN
jgi:glycerol-3-phosphate dehydrogenase (NAD(P)+)